MASLSRLLDLFAVQNRQQPSSGGLESVEAKTLFLYLGTLGALHPLPLPLAKLPICPRVVAQSCLLQAALFWLEGLQLAHLSPWVAFWLLAGLADQFSWPLGDPVSLLSWQLVEILQLFWQPVYQLAWFLVAHLL